MKAPPKKTAKKVKIKDLPAAKKAKAVKGGSIQWGLGGGGKA